MLPFHSGSAEHLALNLGALWTSPMSRERNPSRTSRAEGGYATASEGPGHRAETREAGRDRDPPPGYDGENPETTYRNFEKQVALWEFETDIPKSKRGVKLIRHLTGLAQVAVDHLEIEDITGENGVKNVMSCLREYFTPHLEESMPRAF